MLVVLLDWRRRVDFWFLRGGEEKGAWPWANVQFEARGGGGECIYVWRKSRCENDLSIPYIDARVFQSCYVKGFVL